MEEKSIKVDCSNPYSDIIKRYIHTEFPHIYKPNSADLLEILTDIIVGNKDARYGARPLPESLVVIRDVIRTSIVKDTPIPIMVPWGSVKANLTDNIDVAELSAINQIIHLNTKVTQFYSNGIDVNVRIEDTSGYDLFMLEATPEHNELVIDRYSRSLSNLIKMVSPVINGHTVITPALESTMEGTYKWKTELDMILPVMYEYLTDSHLTIERYYNEVTDLASYIKLKEWGWRGIISYEQRQHYLNTYAKLYGDWDISQQLYRLAIYFASALVRYRLGMTGKKYYWDKHLQLTFTPPVKGVPEGYSANYLQYRTSPDSRTQIAPWRAKGYLKIENDRVVTKILSYQDTDLIDSLIPNTITLSDGTVNSVNISADYLIVN